MMSGLVSSTSPGVIHPPNIAFSSSTRDSQSSVTDMSWSPGVIHPPNIATNNKLDEEKTAFQFILIFFNIFFPNKILLLLQSSIEQDFYQCGKFEILRGVLIGQLLSLEPSYWLNLGYWLRALSLLISSIYWALMWCVVPFVASNLSLPSLAAAIETISKLSSQHFQN